MAAPHVAAAAALVLKAIPGSDPLTIRQILLDTVDVRTSLGESATGGRLNAGAAVASALDGGGPPPDAGDGDGVPDAIDACPTVNGGMTAAGSRPGQRRVARQPRQLPRRRQRRSARHRRRRPRRRLRRRQGRRRPSNAADNCPLVTNADQANIDGDTLGDACDRLGQRRRPQRGRQLPEDATRASPISTATASATPATRRRAARTPTATARRCSTTLPDQYARTANGCPDRRLRSRRQRP